MTQQNTSTVMYNSVEADVLDKETYRGTVIRKIDTGADVGWVLDEEVTAD